CGISSSFTVEGRAEATRGFGAIGAGVVSTLPAQLLGKAAFAASRDNGASGGLWLVGVERLGLRGGVMLQAQGASEHFRQLGQDPGVPTTKLQVAGNANYYSDRAGAFGAGFASIQRYGEQRISTISG